MIPLFVNKGSRGFQKAFACHNSIRLDSRDILLHDFLASLYTFVTLLSVQFPIKFVRCFKYLFLSVVF